MIQATIACNIFIYDLRYCVLWRMLLFFKWFAQFGRERFPWLQRLWPRRPWQKSLTTPGELSGEAIELASSKFSKSWRSCHILPFWSKDFCQVNSSFRNFHFYPILGSGRIASSKLSSSEGALSKLLKQTSKKSCFFLCFTGLFTVSALIPTQSAKGLLLREKAQVHILQLRPSRKYCPEWRAVKVLIPQARNIHGLHLMVCVTRHLIRESIWSVFNTVSGHVGLTVVSQLPEFEQGGYPSPSTPVPRHPR